MPPEQGARNRWLRSSQQAFKIQGLPALALVTAWLMLAACATVPKPAPVAWPPAKPRSSVPAAPKPSRAPATPKPGSVPVVPAPISVVPEPRNYEQEKNRAMLALAKNSQDSLASSEVGYYMDVLQGRLKQVAGQNIGISRQGNRIVLDLSGRLGFEAGSTQMKPGSRAVLAPLSKILVEYRKVLVSVRVGTDGAGAKVANPRLAEERALAIAQYLAEVGVTDKRVMIAGSGRARLPATNASTGNRARVELRLEPIVRAAGGER